MCLCLAPYRYNLDLLPPAGARDEGLRSGFLHASFADFPPCITGRVPGGCLGICPVPPHMVAHDGPGGAVRVLGPAAQPGYLRARLAPELMRCASALAFRWSSGWLGGVMRKVMWSQPRSKRFARVLSARSQPPGAHATHGTSTRGTDGEGIRRVARAALARAPSKVHHRRGGGRVRLDARVVRRGLGLGRVEARRGRLRRADRRRRGLAAAPRPGSGDEAPHVTHGTASLNNTKLTGTAASLRMALSASRE